MWTKTTTVVYSSYTGTLHTSTGLRVRYNVSDVGSGWSDEADIGSSGESEADSSQPDLELDPMFDPALERALNAPPEARASELQHEQHEHQQGWAAAWAREQGCLVARAKRQRHDG